jgi:hypothetical protein
LSFYKTSHLGERSQSRGRAFVAAETLAALSR